MSNAWTTVWNWQTDAFVMAQYQTFWIRVWIEFLNQGTASKFFMIIVQHLKYIYFVFKCCDRYQDGDEDETPIRYQQKYSF